MEKFVSYKQTKSYLSEGKKVVQFFKPDNGQITKCSVRFQADNPKKIKEVIFIWAGGLYSLEGNYVSNKGIFFEIKCEEYHSNDIKDVMRFLKSARPEDLEIAKTYFEDLIENLLILEKDLKGKNISNSSIFYKEFYDYGKLLKLKPFELISPGI